MQIPPPVAPAAAAGPARPDAIDAKAKEFEATFLSQVVDQMLKTAGDGFFGGGQGAETWRSFLSQAVADAVADQSPTGIAQSVAGAMRAYENGGRT